jgi:uncharacterized protein (TIGR02453 family)
MSSFDGFPKGCIPFLRQLAKNNERPWFNENKQRYEACVREPSLAFIEAMGPELTRLSPHFRAIPKKVGGSLMRVYRDTRFAKDKTPYKTNVGIHFRHELARDVHAPGFYVHIEPRNCFVGAGIWHPEAKVLTRIREFIADNPHAWKQAVTTKAFKKDFFFGGDTLKRPPRGFEPDHALITDLKRKDFIALKNFDDGEIQSARFVKFVARSFKQAGALMSYLCMAVDAQY